MPLPFPKKLNGGIPLVGQPMAMLGYTVSMTVECKCGPSGRGGVVTLIAQADHMGNRSSPVTCPACGQSIVLIKMEMDPQGQLLFSFNRMDLRGEVASLETQPKPVLAS